MGAPAVPPRRAGRPAVLRTLAPRLRAGDPRPHATKDRAVTATELAALIVAIASVTAVVPLEVAFVSITKNLRRVRDAVALMRSETVPCMTDHGPPQHTAPVELTRPPGGMGRG